MSQNTIWQPNPDFIAQLTGSGVAIPGFPAQLGSGFIPTYAAAIDIGPLLTYTRWINIVTTSAVGNSTITSTIIPRAGCGVVLQVSNDASGARTLTFSTGFRFSAATLVGTASKIMLIAFVSDGTTLNEVSRTIAET